MKIGWVVTAVLFFGLAQTKAAAQSEHDVVVAADGTGHVKTVQAAIDKIPKQNWKRVVIFIKPGIYNEHVEIPPNKPYVSLRGETAEETKITFNVKIVAGSSDRTACSAFIGGHDVHVKTSRLKILLGRVRRRLRSLPALIDLFSKTVAF
jgi:hypothetical protein